jgi:competence protein ComEC
MIFNLGGGAQLEILFPERDPSMLESNTSSIVARLTYGESEFMFTGDSPTGIENHLVSLYGKTLDSDVLKVGHHGSRTSTSESFIRAVDPEYAIISSGSDNRYGHPHKEVTDLLATFGAEILNTAEVGTIIFETDGKNLKLVD